MVKKLVAMKLLSSAPTRPLSLLRKGENLPDYCAKHRLVELLLVEVMGFEPENVHEIVE